MCSEFEQRASSHAVPVLLEAKQAIRREQALANRNAACRLPRVGDAPLLRAWMVHFRHPGHCKPDAETCLHMQTCVTRRKLGDVERRVVTGPFDGSKTCRRGQ